MTNPKEKASGRTRRIDTYSSFLILQMNYYYGVGGILLILQVSSVDWANKMLKEKTCI